MDVRLSFYHAVNDMHCSSENRRTRYGRGKSPLFLAFIYETSDGDKLVFDRAVAKMPEARLISERTCTDVRVFDN